MLPVCRLQGVVTDCELPLRPPPSILKEVSYIISQVGGDRSRGRKPRESVVSLLQKPLPQLPRQSPECPHLLAPSFLRSPVPHARSQSRPLIPCLPHPPPILSTHRVSFSSSLSRAKEWGEERRSLEHALRGNSCKDSNYIE